MKTHLHGSIIVSAIIIYVSVLVEIPIMYWVIMMGYTYSQVFNSQLNGFIITVPIVFTGCMAATITAFLVSRYLLRDYVQY